MKIKILLLQAREANDPAKEDERHSFALRAGLPLENIQTFDLLLGVPSLSEVSSYDALFVGGSGDYYVSKGNLPGFPRVLDFLADVVAAGHPMFASCFGFQMIVKALGGEIIYDAPGTEVGTYWVTATKEGGADELFGYLPAEYAAQLGRKDRASRLPAGVINLAASERAPFQAIRIPGKPIWATQFHPELTRSENLARFHRYMAGYAGMIPFYVVGVIGVRVISCLGLNRVIFVVGIINLITNVLGNIVLSRYYGVAGIALSTVGVYLLSALIIVGTLTLRWKRDQY